MTSKNRVVRTCYSIVTVIIGVLFFLDITGVFGLILAVVGLIVFVACSLAQTVPMPNDRAFL